MPWKNGQGVTAEIAIEPADAKFPDDDFAWRLSSAAVAADNTFSQFKSYERLLTVVEGEGLTLNNKPLLKTQIKKFSGDEKIECRLIDGSCTDLGLIYKSAQVKASMKISSFAQGPRKLLCQERKLFLYCSEGQFSVGSLTVAAGDCLEIEGPIKLELQIEKACQLVFISIH